MLALPVPEHSKVDSSNLLSLLILLLKGLDISLQLVGEFRHTIQVLPLLVFLDMQLPNLPLSFLVDL